MMGQFVLPLLMLVAECYCAPETLFAAGGTVGYDSRINGTIGGHLKAHRDGLAIDATGEAIAGASWEPTVVARGGVQFGEHAIGGDASLGGFINNSWKPKVQTEIGRTSNGTWVLGLQPQSELINQLLLTPKLQLKTGDDAKALAGFPVENKNEGKQQVPVVTYPYMYYPVPQGQYAYMRGPQYYPY